MKCTCLTPVLTHSLSSNVQPSHAFNLSEPKRAKHCVAHSCWRIGYKIIWGLGQEWQEIEGAQCNNTDLLLARTLQRVPAHRGSYPGT
jgi:hypothetical protein